MCEQCNENHKDNRQFFSRADKIDAAGQHQQEQLSAEVRDRALEHINSGRPWLMITLDPKEQTSQQLASLNIQIPDMLHLIETLNASALHLAENAKDAIRSELSSLPADHPLRSMLEELDNFNG